MVPDSLVVLTTDDFRLAEALAIQKLHGDRAALWIATRRGELMLAGDAAGVERLGEIAAKLEQLLAAQRRAASS